MRCERARARSPVIAGTALQPGRRRWPFGPRAVALLLVALLCGATLSSAHAHLMVAQRGTLNLVDGGGFLVLSVPVSALSGVDDDGDGLLSASELQRHEAAIRAQVARGVQLLAGGDDARPRPLQGVLLQLSSPDHATAGAARQMVVMGRYDVGAQRDGLRLRLSLYGSAADEQAHEVTVSRGDAVQRLLLAPGREEGEILPSAWRIAWDFGRQGMAHVLGGADHLLFLLVVLASGQGLRHRVWALSCFTVGHGITLAAVALGGLAAPAAVVEPAIAASIVGMAWYDHHALQRVRAGGTVARPGVRLALVFGAALVHGLGLAGALVGLGVDLRHRLWGLAGFNAGVEAGQLLVAAVAVGALLALRRLAGGRGQRRALRLASVTAMVAGSAWLAQRLAVLV